MVLLMKKFYFILLICLIPNLSFSSGCIKGDCKNGDGIFKAIDNNNNEFAFIGEFKNGELLYGKLASGKDCGRLFPAAYFKTDAAKAKLPLLDKSFKSLPINLLNYDYVYVGNFKDNKKEGEGVTYNICLNVRNYGIYKNGNIIKGTLEAINTDRFEHFTPDGFLKNRVQVLDNAKSHKKGRAWIKYTGEFKNGLPEGNGTVTYRNGNIYVGQIKDFLEHGEGILTYKKSGEKTGIIFKNGKIMDYK